MASTSSQRPAPVPLLDPTDDFDDLEALLAQATTEHAEKQLAKKSLERLRRGGQSAEQVREDAARVAEWQARHEWRAVANVARFEEQRCDRCASTAYHQEGLFTRRVHRHLAATQDWIRTEVMDSDLPNETWIKRVHVPFCAECCDEVGFSWQGEWYYEDGTPEDVLEAVDDSEAEGGDELSDALDYSPVLVPYNPQLLLTCNHVH